MNLIEQIESWDRQLFLFLNSLHSPIWDFWMWNFSEAIFWLPVYLIFLYFLQKKIGWKGMFLALVGVALVVTCCDLISTRALKYTIMRYRPTHNLEIKHLIHTVNNYRGGDYGFVSSHAANFFGIATFIGLILKKQVKFILGFTFVWAGLVAYSRIYLGVHYPLDILGGAILGILIGLVMVKFYWEKFYFLIIL